MAMHVMNIGVVGWREFVGYVPKLNAKLITISFSVLYSGCLICTVCCVLNVLQHNNNNTLNNKDRNTAHTHNQNIRLLYYTLHIWILCSVHIAKATHTTNAHISSHWLEHTRGMKASVKCSSRNRYVECAMHLVIFYCTFYIAHIPSKRQTKWKTYWRNRSHLYYK